MSTLELPTVFSNINVFYEISVDTFSESEKAMNNYRRPTPSGCGFILKHDPDKRSFKAGLISTVFSAAYIDLHLRLAYFFQHKKSPSKTWDRMKYEEKLKSLGVADPSVLKNFEKFRLARNDVVHEKPLVVAEPSILESGTAQDLAKLGVALVKNLRQILPLNAMPRIAGES